MSAQVEQLGAWAIKAPTEESDLTAASRRWANARSGGETYAIGRGSFGDRTRLETHGTARAANPWTVVFAGSTSSSPSLATQPSLSTDSFTWPRASSNAFDLSEAGPRVPGRQFTLRASTSFPSTELHSARRAEALLASRAEALASNDANPPASRTPYASVIWSLVEGQQLRKARALLKMLPNESEYFRLRRLLSPPTAALSGRKDFERSAEYRWIAEHAQEHVGRWIAISGDSLLAVCDTLRELRRAVKDLAPGRAPLFYFVE